MSIILNEDMEANRQREVAEAYANSTGNPILYLPTQRSNATTVRYLNVPYLCDISTREKGRMDAIRDDLIQFTNDLDDEMSYTSKFDNFMDYSTKCSYLVPTTPIDMDDFIESWDSIVEQVSSFPSSQPNLFCFNDPKLALRPANFEPAPKSLKVCKRLFSEIYADSPETIEAVIADKRSDADPLLGNFFLFVKFTLTG